MALIDLLAIIPFFLPAIFKIDLRFIRAVRLIRIFRLLKFGRYTKAVKLLSEAFRLKREELLICVFTTLVLLIIASSLMYYIEHDAQPDKFSSIPQTMWWGIVTLTTVGYGDSYPITPLGRIFGAVICFLGIGLFALPAGIISAGFSQAITKEKNDLSS